MVGTRANCAALSGGVRCASGKVGTDAMPGVRPLLIESAGRAGYSRLKLPVSEIKIDKSFIKVISGSGNSNNLTDFIVKIGQSLDLCIVAEGIETQQQLDYLSGIECDKMQGFLMSRPLPEKDALEVLRRNKGV